LSVNSCAWQAASLSSMARQPLAPLLLALAGLRRAPGRRFGSEWLWASAHCRVEVAGEALCWQGPEAEGRLKAICAGSEVEGECQAGGFRCDVSGASVERFTLFMGLQVFAEPSEGGTCVDRQLDLKEAVMGSALLNNKVCPPIVNAIRQWHENAQGPISNITAALAGCSDGVTSERCTQRMTDLVAPVIVKLLFDLIEREHGIWWARKVVQLHGATPMIERVPKIPEGVKAFATQFHLTLEKPVEVANHFLRQWSRVRSLLSTALEPFMKPFVYPMMGLLLSQFPETHEDHVQAALVHSGKLRAFHAALKEQLDGVIDNFARVCSLVAR